MDTDAGLGPLVSAHRVDNRTRRQVGRVTTAVGVAAGALTLLLFLLPIDRALARLLGLVLGLGIAFLIIGITTLVKAFRGGRGERVDLHEHGIAYRTARGVRRWPWERITAIQVRETGTSNPLALKLGTDYWCAVEIEGRRRLVISGLTRDHHALVRAMAEHRHDVYVPDLPTALVRLRWCWLGIGIAFFVALAAAIVFLITHPDTEVSEQHGNITEYTKVPAISKDVQPYFYGGMIACIVLGFTGVRLYLHATRERR
ncbi:hypothetical protein [Amycolatopsis samaneae]|uniref:PH domain-containing protein n=1 Tax=Amycolatopsis samaneae TaxID=664691 RepID=A0ABW5GT59_9PSEU